MKNQTPEKPDKQKDQISMLWDACFNDIPHRLKWQDVKINFILGFMGVVLTLIAVILVFIGRL